MYVKKELVGTQQINEFGTSYYLVSKGDCFGVGIEENHGVEVLWGEEYFTESETLAQELCHKIYRGSVTLTTLTNVIDDMI